MSKFGFSTAAEEVVAAFPSRIQGRTFVITGLSANGLGAHTAISLARAEPAHFILLSRNKAKVDPVIEEIISINSSIKISFVQVTLDDFDSVRKAANEVNQLTDHVDVLINNAGVMAIPNYTVNKNGIETQMATNHLGHFLLTKLLMPKIEVAAAAASNNSTKPRIINLTSRGHQISPFLDSDPSFTNPEPGTKYNPWTAYGQTKTANILFTLLLSKSPTLQSSQIRSFAVHPGGIYSTGLSTHLTPEDFEQVAVMTLNNTGVPFTFAPAKNLTQGTSSTLWAALDPALDDVIANEIEGTGLYVSDCNFEVCREHARNLDQAKKLWAWSEKMTGETFQI